MRLPPGLFHDMGIVLVMPEAPTGSLRFDSGVLKRDDGPSHRHEEISAWMAEQWGMTDRIVEAIRYHHTPSHARVDPVLTATVHVADVLSQRIDIGRYAHDRLTGYDRGALEVLGLTEEQLTPESLGEEIAKIRAGVEHAPDFEAPGSRTEECSGGITRHPSRNRAAPPRPPLSGGSADGRRRSVARNEPGRCHHIAPEYHGETAANYSGMRLADAYAPMISPEQIKEKVQSIIQLPALPTVAMEIVDLVDNPKTSASKLGKLISTDQALTAKVLKIANSPFYGFPRKNLNNRFCHHRTGV